MTTAKSLPFLSSLKEFTVIHLDTEATSFSVYKEHVVQLAAEAWTFRDGKLESTGQTFNEYVRTDRPMDARAAAVTGIDDDTVQSAPARFGDVFYKFIKWCIHCNHEQFENGNVPILWVAHNGIGFDVPILLQEMERHLVQWTVLKEARIHYIFDTMRFLKDKKWARDPKSGRAFPTTKKGAPSYKLGGVFRTFFEDETFQEHDALADTTAMARILEKIDECTEGKWKSHALFMKHQLEAFDRKRGDRMPSAVDVPDQVPEYLQDVGGEEEDKSWYMTTECIHDICKDLKEEYAKKNKTRHCGKRKRVKEEQEEGKEVVVEIGEHRIEQLVKRTKTVTCSKCERVTSVHFEHWISECKSGD